MDFWSFVLGTFVGSLGVIFSLLFGYMASMGQTQTQDERLQTLKLSVDENTTY